MPPGRTLVEALFGRAGPIHRLLGGGKQAARQQVAHIRTSAKSHAQASAQQVASQTSANASGRLVQGLADVVSSLIHAPGVRGNAKTFEGAHKVVGRTINARAAYHTLSQSTRPRAGFGTLRPNPIPRSGHTLGLSSARNFSSSRTVFENVVNNAPLGLRVLGDKDRLDMRKFKREMKAAYLKKRQAEAGKGKGRMNVFDSVKALPTTFDSYFPVTVESATTQATVQLILPLNPVNESTTFLSYTEDAESSRFFSAMLMSDLHMLSELHGNHHARLRNIIRKLEMAGCFEPDSITGEDLVQAQLDHDARCIVVTFKGSRWGMADVRQVLGLYDPEATTWYKLVDLGEEDNSLLDDSPPPSSLPSDVESLTSSVAGSVYSFDDTEEYERVVSSLRVPTLGHLAVHNNAPRDSYLWGVSDFLEGLDAGTRPSFRRY